jgi:hypothetical protein
MKQPDERSRRLFLKASSMWRLAMAFSPGTTGEAFANSQSKTIQKEDTMTQSSAIQRGSSLAADKTTIRPFHVNVPEAELTELRRRGKKVRYRLARFRLLHL